MDGTKGKPPITVKHSEFSLMQLAARMRQANYRVFNIWKKVWVAGFLGKKHSSIIRSENHLNECEYQPLHRDKAVTDFTAAFENWLTLASLDNAK